MFRCLYSFEIASPFFLHFANKLVIFLRMQRVAIVLRKNRSDWVSCQSITGNLLRCYSSLFPSQNRLFLIEEPTNTHQLRRLATEILLYDPERLVFIDHAPHPGPLLSLLHEMQSDFSAQIVFHIFGDFTLQAREWLTIESLLKKHSTLFISASFNHNQLLQSLIDASPNSFATIPFPVDSKHFFHESVPANFSWRQKLSTPESDFVFLYSGRLSLQKNIHSLIRVFSSYLLQINPQAELWLAGPADDLGLPYLGKKNPAGLYSHEVVSQIQQALPEKLRYRVRYLGDFDSKNLRRLCLEADHYVSLSTHNDEDYGMAPAEALMSGLPCLLTQWGGFSSFQKLVPSGVRLTPVNFEDLRVLPDSLKALKSMAALQRPQLSAREKIAAEARNALSIEAVTAKLQEVLENATGLQFHKFSQKHQRLTQAYRANPEAPFANGPQYSQFYKEIYANYCR